MLFTNEISKALNGLCVYGFNLVASSTLHLRHFLKPVDVDFKAFCKVVSLRALYMHRLKPSATIATRDEMVRWIHVLSGALALGLFSFMPKFCTMDPTSLANTTAAAFPMIFSPVKTTNELVIDAATLGCLLMWGNCFIWSLKTLGTRKY